MAFFGVVFVVVLATMVALLATAISTLISGELGGVVLVLVLIVLVGAAGSRGMRSVRRTLEPLGDLVEASARVEAGELGTQVSVRGPREVRALARAFNEMSSRLAASEAQRRRLFADVSHELRTPLTVIQGNVEAMLDGVYPADRSHLERILAETRQLERLIEDLRTLSMAETGSLTLHREPTDLGALVASVVGGFQPEAAAAGVSLAVEPDSGLSSVSLDPRRMRQVVANLVSNALRNTPAGGGVRVSVRELASEMVLEVADTGRGMDEEARRRAFERFWRSPDSRGAGLGLPIVRDLVEAHGGRVELESAAGEGTTVTCRLPVEG